jgi:ElaB/YqjD/DUF883 family membrane-anchored ribosome-binding protein
LPDQENYELGRTGPPAPAFPTSSPSARPGIDMPTSSSGRAGASEPSVADQAQDKAQQVAGQAQDKAQQAAGQARDQLRSQVEQRTSQAAEQINQQANDLRTVSQSLREQGQDGPAKAADRLAGYAERVGGYLREARAEQLLHDAEDLGRKRPWAAAGAGAAVGLAASRFLKASSRERYATRSAGRSRPASPVGGPRPGIGSPGAVGGASPVGVPAGAPPLPTPNAPLSGQTPGI